MPSATSKIEFRIQIWNIHPQPLIPNPYPPAMPDLIAQGIEAQQRWRRTLTEGEEIVLGRLGGAWAVPWDQQVSRRHAALRGTAAGTGGRAAARGAEPHFSPRRGGRTMHGWRPANISSLGRRRSRVADQQVSVTSDSPEPMQQQSFSAQYLKEVRFRNPDHRIEVLSRLPDVISGASDDQELFVRLVSMLLAGVPRADAAAVVAVETDGGGGQERARTDRSAPARPRPAFCTGTSGWPSAAIFGRAGADPRSAAAAAERAARVARGGGRRRRIVYGQR